MRLPNVGSSDWKWENDNGWVATGVEPKWEITIRWDWIEIAFYPTPQASVIASLALPSPDNDEDAKRVAEECAIFLHDKVCAIAYENPSIAKQVPYSVTDGHT